LFKSAHFPSSMVCKEIKWRYCLFTYSLIVLIKTYMNWNNIHVCWKSKVFMHLKISTHQIETNPVVIHIHFSYYQSILPGVIKCRYYNFYIKHNEFVHFIVLKIWCGHGPKHAQWTHNKVNEMHVHIGNVIHQSFCVLKLLLCHTKHNLNWNK